MKVVLFYGGRGLIEDPMLFMLKQTEKVLRELEVDVERINLFEFKGTINTLPQIINGSDGIILATTVEWLGIGGYMQTFLDACWYYGDKNEIAKVYMLPMIISTSYGEREAELQLIKAWDLIGGIPSPGLVGYVKNAAEFETSKVTLEIIEKSIEKFYRTLLQKPLQLPSSAHLIKDMINGTGGIDFSPQETEQLSKLVNNDEFVKKQKEDIEELSSFFKLKMNSDEKKIDTIEYIVGKLRSSFKGQLGFEAAFKISISDKSKNLILQISKGGFNCFIGEMEEVDVIISLTSDVLSKIVDGRMSFQRGFMTGEISVKGNFKTLYSLDQVFKFK
jgi:putative sterol carrier protein